MEIHTLIRDSTCKDFDKMRERLLINEGRLEHLLLIKDLDNGRSIEFCLDLIGLIRIILQNHWCLSDKGGIEFHFE